MPDDWTGIPPAVGAVAAVVAALMNLYRGWQSRTAALPAHDAAPAIALPVAAAGPVAVRIAVSGPCEVRVAVAGQAGTVLVEVLLAAPQSAPSGPSAKERAPW
ncbi:hypothetical protein ACFY15_36325 [Streptomyces sp. NPDC001373]|uniref:hypothetical protein n=1 Tax=Streptomyces sp. NPDC001373 TaxID=3364565 RepID=UPI0036A45B85